MNSKFNSHNNDKIMPNNNEALNPRITLDLSILVPGSDLKIRVSNIQDRDGIKRMPHQFEMPGKFSLANTL